MIKIPSLLQRLGNLFLLFGFAQCIPLIAAVYFGGPDQASFLFSIMLSLGIGAVLRRLFRTEGDLEPREGFLLVVGGWLTAGVLGAVPFYLSGTFATWTDAVFESVSGLTTTGATLLAHPDQLPAGILVWRGMLQWLGGMGIIVLFVAVFQYLGIGGVHLFSAEMPGIQVEKLTPRIRRTASLLWKMYITLTVLAVVGFWAVGLSPFDAMLHAFTTVSTGGFSNQPHSIESFANPSLEWIMILCMFLGGMNFALQYRVFWRLDWKALKDTEWLTYVALIGVATVLVSIPLQQQDGGWTETIRKAAFQVVSILTTTGFSSADYDAWPIPSRVILLSLYFIGGMAGSTSGGLKIIRLVIALRNLVRGLVQILHPHSETPIFISGKPIAESTVRRTFQFFVAYFGLFGLSGILISFAGFDLMTTFSAVIATLGNVGPGFGWIGPHENFDVFPTWVKLTLTFLMIVGRLEVITVLILFYPPFWRRQ